MDESARQAKIAHVLAVAFERRALLQPDVTSDHSWLYDERGLPVGRGNFGLTDVRPAQKPGVVSKPA